MDVFAEEPTLGLAVAREMAANDGQAVLRDVALPDTFDPPVGDVVLHRSDAGIELWLSHAGHYHGTSPTWRGIQNAPAIGHARHVDLCRGGISEALALLRRHLTDAGGTVRGDRDANVVSVSPPTTLMNVAELAESDGHLTVGNLRLRDLVAEARTVTRSLAERPHELSALVVGLTRATKRAVLLIGLTGVGKTSLVELLAASIADGAVAGPLANSRIIELPLARLLEDARYLGALERQVHALLEHEDIVFFVDEAHQLARPELQPVADLLKPALAAGRLRLIAATTPTEWRQVQDKALRRRFTELSIAEPTPVETLAMLSAQASAVGLAHGVNFVEDDLREAVALAARFLPHRPFPDKAVDILDHAGALQATEVEEVGGSLAKQYLIAAIAAQTGLPSALLDRHRAHEAMHGAVEEVAARVIGQEAALSRLQQVLTARVAERKFAWNAFVQHLVEPPDARPLVCVLAVGPTGVGKSETARRLADALYGGRIITLNGSDVGPEAPHGVATWVGAPPGYVGYNQGGILTDGLRAHPASVILIDEIEKAATTAMRNVLLPLLGDGIVTDRNDGEALSARECVVFVTSNLALPIASNDALADALPYDTPADQGALRSILSELLSAELLGRFHAVLAYRPLGMDERWAIWLQQLEHLSCQRGTHPLDMDPSARDWVNDRLSTVQTGAREVLDLFRETVLPLVAGQPDGIRLTYRGGKLALDR